MSWRCIGSHRSRRRGDDLSADASCGPGTSPWVVGVGGSLDDKGEPRAGRSWTRKRRNPRRAAGPVGAGPPALLNTFAEAVASFLRYSTPASRQAGHSSSVALSWRPASTSAKTGNHFSAGWFILAA